jgi:hypothetical protein
LTETPTEYTQPDGYFPNQYYNGGVQAVPADYNRKVYQTSMQPAGFVQTLINKQKGVIFPAGDVQMQHSPRK